MQLKTLSPEIILAMAVHPDATKRALILEYVAQMTMANVYIVRSLADDPDKNVANAAASWLEQIEACARNKD